MRSEILSMQGMPLLPDACRVVGIEPTFAKFLESGRGPSASGAHSARVDTFVISNSKLRSMVGNAMHLPTLQSVILFALSSRSQAQQESCVPASCEQASQRGSRAESRRRSRSRCSVTRSQKAMRDRGLGRGSGSSLLRMQSMPSRDLSDLAEEDETPDLSITE